MFPIKIKFYGEECSLGLSLGCKYISSLNEKEKKKIYKRVIRFISKFPKDELDAYLNLMYKSYLISKAKKFWMKKLMGFRKEGGSWRLISFHN